MSYYGIDANGMPMADSGGQAYPQEYPPTGAPQCPQGQKFDTVSGSCMPTGTPQATVQQAAAPAANPNPTSAGNGCPPGQSQNAQGQCVGGGQVNAPAAGNDYNQVAGWYDTYLGPGRAQSGAGDIQGWLASGLSLGDIQNKIANSPEAAAYAANKPVTATGAPAPAGGGGGYLSNVAGGITAAPNSYAFTPFDPTKSGVPVSPNFTPDATQQATSDLLMKMLTTTSMNPGVVAQMKEAQKGTLLTGADQLRQQILQDAARRGVVSGGNTQGLIDTNALATLGKISDSYRNTDIAAAQQNRTDQMNAIGASGNFQNMLLQQFLQPQQLQLSQRQEGFNQYSTQEAMRKAQADAAFQQWLQAQGLNLGAREFDQNQQLNMAKFLAGA